MNRHLVNWHCMVYGWFNRKRHRPRSVPFNDTTHHYCLCGYRL